MKTETTNSIEIDYLVNPFEVNDYWGEDEITLAIYSDVYDQMFKCGQFKLKSGDAIDFKGLRIPCQYMVGITLLESDDIYNDGKTIMVPCSN